MRTFTALAHVDLGFSPDPILMVGIDARRSATAPADRFALYDRLREAATTVPGVAGAAASVVQPVSGNEWDTLIENPEGVSLPEPERQVFINKVTPGWFATYGTPILAGRDFDARDARNALGVALVNETFVKKFIPGGNPIGRTIRELGDGSSLSRSYEIIGVVRDAVYLSPRDPVPPTMYQALSQGRVGLAQGATLAVRAAHGSPSALARSLGDALMQVDPDLSLTFTPFRESIRAVTAQERVLALMSAFFGGLALLLAGLGLYGLMSYAVSRRRAEIGIRLALGAGPGSAVALVLRRVAWLVGAGAVAGTLIATWGSQYIGSLLFGLQPRDPVTLVTAAAVLAGVGLAAAGLPAWRASRIDPARVLREG
jgi:predicted permease